MSMQLNPSEISELIKERIKDFDASAEARTEGTVVSRRHYAHSWPGRRHAG